MNFLELKDNFEIEAFDDLRRQNISDFVAFTGSPRKHPYKKDRVILISDPFTQSTHYYEFKTRDIACAKELPNITDESGNSTTMIRIWVKKHSIALRCTPFVVEQIPMDKI